MALSDSFKRSNELTRGQAHFPSTVKRHSATALAGLVVLLAVISGAAPAVASAMSGGSQGMPVLALKPAQPGPPTGLTATAISSAEIDLSWTPPRGETPAGYDVYDGTRSHAEDNLVNSSLIHGTTYKVTGLGGGQTYYFVVDAADSQGTDGPDSVEADAMTLVPAGSPEGSPPGGSPEGSPPGGLAGPSGSSGGSWGIIILLLFVAAMAGALIVWWRRRRPALLAAPGSSVQAVARADPLGPVTIHATGRGATLTVRIERHSSPGVTTIEEAL